MSLINRQTSIDTTQNRSNQRIHNSTNQSTDNCEIYLKHVLTNPLTLKQLTRIVIRNRIIENMKNFEFVRNFALSSKHFQRIVANGIDYPDSLSEINKQTFQYNYCRRTSSILECIIWKLNDLPRILHQYLYSFPDVPVASYDLTVFIND